MEEEFIEEYGDMPFDGDDQGFSADSNIYDDMQDTSLLMDEEVSDSEKPEIHFGGHTSGKCNLCGCTHFRPSSDAKYCLCGHSDYDHEWI